VSDERNRTDTAGKAHDARMLEAVNSARLATLGMLMAGMAHEVNTPLGALASNHDVIKRAMVRLQDILADEVVDEDELVEVRRIVKALDGILRVNDLAIERVVGLVESLRSFGRLDRSQVDRVDVHEGIETTLTLLGHRLGDRITVERDFGRLPLVECFPQQINQVFMNLLMNASQAIEGPGRITIRTR
jgi:two-component system, NtrC family, sensor kinase